MRPVIEEAKMKPFKKSILCIGAGYVGGPTMAVIAKKCPDYKVHVVDISSARIDAWNSDDLPIFEPGLDQIVKDCRGTNLFFSTEIEAGIRESEIIFVSVNTPTKTYGVGSGQAADLQFWESTARKISEVSKTSKIVVEKSTLPVRTAEAMARILHSTNGGVKFEVVSNPEFLAEGSAIQDLLEPDRILVGSDSTASGLAAGEEVAQIYRHWVPDEKILTTNVWSSELSKLTANAFLAQRVSSINAMSALCEETGADVGEVARAVGMDRRVGSGFLKASVGFGGSCFKKDILNLAYIAETYGLSEVADYWRQVIRINEYQQQRFITKMIRAMFNTLAQKRIAILGFAFKANTGDTRESPAITVASKLVEEQAQVVISDPRALKNAKEDLKPLDQSRIELEEDPYQAVSGAHAIAVLTEWDIYKNLDYEKLFKSMQKPAFVFDGRNILDHKKLHEIGFNVYPIGKEPLLNS